MADGVAVFNDILTLLYVFDKHFVSCRRVLIDGDAKSINLNNIALLLGLQANHHRVGRVDFQECSLFHRLVFVLFVFLSSESTAIESHVLLGQNLNGHVVDGIDLLLQHDSFKE